MNSQLNIPAAVERTRSPVKIVREIERSLMAHAAEFEVLVFRCDARGWPVTRLFTLPCANAETVDLVATHQSRPLAELGERHRLAVVRRCGETGWSAWYLDGEEQRKEFPGDTPRRKLPAELLKP